jgi:hypothetical protein
MIGKIKISPDENWMAMMLRRKGWRSGTTTADGITWVLYLSPYDGKMYSLRQAWEAQKKHENQVQ